MIEITVCNYSDPAHREAIASLINAYIDDEMGGGVLLSQEEQQRMIDGLSAHPKSIVLLACDADVFVGMLTAFENFSTFTAQPMINIHDVFVLNDWRGKGVGRKLMNAIIAEAGKRKCSRITLEVRKDNVKAQNLYQSLGFDEAGHGMFYWRKYLTNTV
ncbi:MAG: GNAT family N-acetyltransferase [Prevotellaceae bacterium]|jgi:ribosomal protein S18 acetylase RimI-like enzyme|nr:GNAT family N-acetyltransferase [Prevotellaceae bacterium]